MPYPTKAYNQSCGEWFELYNNSTQQINLVNWTVRENKRKNESFQIKTNLIIRPRQYIVFGTSDKTSINGGVTVNYVYNAKSLDLANSDQLMLVNRNGRRIDMVKWNTSNFPNNAAAGSSIALRSISYVSPNTVGARWCLSSTPYGQGDRGTPGRANDCPPFIVGGGSPTVPTPRQPVTVNPPMAPPTASLRPVKRPVAPTPAVNPRPVVRPSKPTRPLVPSVVGGVSESPSSEPSLEIGEPIVDTPTIAPRRPPVRPPTRAPVLPPTRVPIRVPTKAPIRVPVPTKAPIRAPMAPVPSSAPRTVQITAYINEITQTNRTIAVPLINTNPLDYKIPEDLALQWLINDDPLKLTPNSTAAKFRITQRYVLTSMYFQPYAPGTGFPNITNWFNSEECTWNGVACAPRNIGGGLTQSAITSFVTDYTYYAQLQGAITPEMGLLSHLESLDLANNKLIGPLPASMGQLSRLTSLTLQSNTLTGTLPESLGMLTRLASLNVGSNTLTGKLPGSLKQLTQLTSLNVQKNDIEGTVPSSYGSLTQLVYANFENTKLSGTMPTSFCNRTLSYYFVYADCPNEIICTCCYDCRS